MYSILLRWLQNKLSFLALAICLISYANLCAQVNQPRRFEVPLNNYDTRFEIIPAEEAGLFLYRVYQTNKQSEMQLIRLDTAFNEKWSGFLPFERNYLLMGKRAYKNNLYLLLRYRDYTKNDLFLVVVNSDNGAYTRHTIRGFIPFSPTEFQVTDQAVLVGGYYNRVPLVLHYSLKTNSSKVLPGIFNESGELTQVRTYEDGSFDVLISAMNFERRRTIWIKNYDGDGNLNRNFSLDAEQNKHLIFGRAIKTNNNNQIVAGVYGTRSAEFSHGIFIASIDPSGLQQIRYYNFGDLENFFKYMKAKREQRVKSRIERRKRVRFNYRFLVHELVEYDNQFILLGEAFYPKYTTVDRGGYFFTPVGYSGIVRNGRIFDGYYYTHAVVMGFKPNGDLVWDNSFEINDVRTFTLEQFVKLETDENQINLLYLFDNNIRTKIIRDNEVLEGKSVDPILTGRPDEIVRRNYSNDINKLEYWYSDYLYAYGVQEIENKSDKNKPSRRVFYINKIRNASTNPQH
jgi:hypothetical protein